VELHDRIGEAEALEAVAGAAEPAESDMPGPDAALALIALGYKQEQARRWSRRRCAPRPPAT